MEQSLDITSLKRAYASGTSPQDILSEVYTRIAARGDDGTWIHLIPETEVREKLANLEPDLPLYGIPFAIKDNIDAAGHPTTAACPAYSYIPEENATVVSKLQAAGAVLIGKTNMDQFATGLVGVRSPHGAVKNAFDTRYISGGSSAGSAVAVAAGLVSFALGTDTAGSGRVPAAFNNLIGLKPTRGMVSAAGVVPACQSLDCVSIFALTVDDAKVVLEQAAGFDARDPYSRHLQTSPTLSHHFRFGTIPPDQLQTFGDTSHEARYFAAIDTLTSLGGTPLEIDFTPFRETAELLYGGPWVSERVSALGEFYQQHQDDLHPVLQQILQGAEKYSAKDVFDAMHRLEHLRRQTEPVWDSIDLLLTPTTSDIYTLAEVDAEPLARNSRLGFYTNFVNLLDLSALALPAGFGDEGLPCGITLVAPAWHDGLLTALGKRFQAVNGFALGATKHALPNAHPPELATPSGTIDVAVFGAHLSGQPLNYQLTERGATLVKTCRTAAAYRFYALPGDLPKPGLLRSDDGAAIETEVWRLPLRHFGSFVGLVPPPLVIGTVELDDGSTVKGFLCEPWALADATDITDLGSWRKYVAG